MSTWVKEFDESGELRMDRAVTKLRDEITGVAMVRHNGHDRDLAIVMTKLDEAELWARRYLEKTGVITTIDRAEILKSATTDTTDTTEAENHV